MSSRWKIIDWFFCFELFRCGPWSVHSFFASHQLLSEVWKCIDLNWYSIGIALAELSVYFIFGFYLTTKQQKKSIGRLKVLNPFTISNPTNVTCFHLDWMRFEAQTRRHPIDRVNINSRQQKQQLQINSSISRKTFLQFHKIGFYFHLFA